MIEIGARYSVGEIIRLRRDGELIVFSVSRGIEVCVNVYDARVLLRALDDRVRAAEKLCKQRLAAERRAKRAVKP